MLVEILGIRSGYFHSKELEWKSYFKGVPSSRLTYQQRIAELEENLETLRNSMETERVQMEKLFQQRMEQQLE